MVRLSIFLFLTLIQCSAVRSLKSFTVSRHNIPSATLLSMTSSPPTTIDVRSEQFQLSSGVSMQVTYSVPAGKVTNKPPLLFLHGSFHGSWCWTERFFPYFVEKGYPVVALNWRGTAGTFAGEGVKKVKIMDHVADLKAFLDDIVPSIAPAGAKKPILICHSFGGLAVMKYLEKYTDHASKLGGVVTMCSVPPSGIGTMTLRYLRKSFMDSWRITAGFAMKRVLTNDVLCRQLFFGGEKKATNDGAIVDDHGLSDEDINRYQTYFARDSIATIDLFDLSKQLPSVSTNKDGKALFADRLPPCLVMGGSGDMIVDLEGLKETAVYFGLDDYKLVDSPHDVMLGSKWKNAADALEEWMSKKVNK